MRFAWMSRAFAVGVALLLVAATAACGGEEPDDPPPYVVASDVCGGAFQEKRASEAVERILGPGPYASAGRDAVERVADALRDAFASGRSWSSATELCPLAPKRSRTLDQGSIAFSIYDPSDVGTGKLPAGARFYAMGKEAVAGPAMAEIYFTCASPDLETSADNPLRIQGRLSLGSALNNDSKEHREAGLTVVHAASLAVAEELKCEGNGGLPQKPVLTEAP
ncbi:hypothetical protein QFZ82_002644 [Streptomyces sp. V4I23]|uniref:hypothetical protein n=1 Tax=Streptomyces sp. V4I23 TaxID=3042282 RepID=UPI0027867084|nr:hypothetical protein [Streptomyces sp. V4I23]MDQ1008159.1 hypothetical protein [Streptomyces sp. V4I23]